MRDLLLEHQTVEVWYNGEINSIEFIWRATPDFEDYKNIFREVALFTKQNRPEGWLSDIRMQGIVSLECSKWLSSEIIPQAIENGMKKIAVISNQDIFQQFYVAQVEERIEGKLELVQSFRSVEEANKWLKA